MKSLFMINRKQKVLFRKLSNKNCRKKRTANYRKFIKIWSVDHNLIRAFIAIRKVNIIVNSNSNSNQNKRIYPPSQTEVRINYTRVRVRVKNKLNRFLNIHSKTSSRNQKKIKKTNKKSSTTFLILICYKKPQYKKLKAKKKKCKSNKRFRKKPISSNPSRKSTIVYSTSTNKNIWLCLFFLYKWWRWSASFREVYLCCSETSSTSVFKSQSNQLSRTWLSYWKRITSKEALRCLL